MSLRLGAAGLTLAVSLSGAVLVSPASAAYAAPPPLRVAAGEPSADASANAVADAAFVRWLAMRDARANVRNAAWTALISSARDAAVAQFLKTGYESARKRAATVRSRNIDFVDRVIATHPAEQSPEVQAAAQYARGGSDLDRDRFARGGYEAARQRDRLAREVSGEQARALVEADRAFVAGLRDSDPGAQVRASAAWALRPGATDDDLVEFFAAGWVHGASLDLQVHRTRLSDSHAAWRTTVRRLISEAEAAERAAVQLSGEAAVQARASAAAAWRSVTDGAAPARSVWADAQATADQQAANWHAVLLAALAADGPLWTPVRTNAQANGVEWAAEQATAEEQAGYWEGLLAQARAGEERMSTAPQS